MASRGATFEEFIATAVQGGAIDMRDPEKVKSYLRKSAEWSRKYAQMNASGISDGHACAVAALRASALKRATARKTVPQAADRRSTHAASSAAGSDAQAVASAALRKVAAKSRGRSRRDRA
jgi:hypothetical protein